MRKSKGFARGKQIWLVPKQMTTRLIRMQKLMIGKETVKEPQNPNWEVVVLPHPGWVSQPQLGHTLSLLDFLSWPPESSGWEVLHAHVRTHSVLQEKDAAGAASSMESGGHKRASWQPFNLSPVKATFESHHTGSWDNGSKPGTCLPRLPACKIPGSMVGDPGKDRYPPPGKT